jgi:hypothetical protein
LEALWFVLALAALHSPAARLFLCVLLGKALASYAVVWMAEGQLYGYALTVLLDLWALYVLYAVSGFSRWGDVARWAQLAVLISQATFWTAYTFGWYLGEEAFHVGRGLFTIQLAALAWPGVQDVAGSIRRFRRSVRRRERQSARIGRDDVLGVCHSRHDEKPQC